MRRRRHPEPDPPPPMALVDIATCGLPNRDRVLETPRYWFNTPQTRKLQAWYMKHRMPASFTKLFSKAYRGKSRKAAVASKCLLCKGFDWKAVKLCNLPQCPLWTMRPGRPPKNPWIDHAKNRADKAAYLASKGRTE